MKSFREYVLEAEESLSQRIARQRAAREARDGTPDEIKARKKVRDDAFHEAKHKAIDHHIGHLMNRIKEPNLSIHDATRMMSGLNKLMSKKPPK